MPNYEYRILPAPSRGLKARGIKTPEARFSYALQTLMNKMGADGWEYQRAETLPSIERAGLTSTTTEWRNVLVFRRMRADSLDAFQPERLPEPEHNSHTIEPPQPIALPPQVAAPAAPVVPQPAEAASADPQVEVDAEIIDPRTPDDDASASRGASRMLRDNGVEEASDVSGVTSSLRQLVANRTAKKSKD